MANKGALITRTNRKSIAREVGIEPGDRLLSINNIIIKDILDYRFLSADEYLELKINKPNGETWVIEIEKEYSETLGLEFDQVVFDGIRPCNNRCLFCFVDQLPEGMRKNLYFKDDDYRLSFISGNFITMTNLTRKDWKKIKEMRPSPLYISVHSTDPEIRATMLGNRRASRIKQELTLLKEFGIEVHCQIVLCPGINDNDELAKTIKDLSSYWPSVQSIGIVPVGLTGHRENLAELRPVDNNQAQTVIELCEGWQKKYRRMFGVGFVYAADEFFIKTNSELPPANYYDSYPQLENGIGMGRSFLDEFKECLNAQKLIPSGGPKIHVICGLSARPVLEKVAEWLKEKDIDIDILAITNQYFGGGVTVTGLLTGQDILPALKGIKIGEHALIPAVVLGNNQEVFLDDMSTRKIKSLIKNEIKVVDMKAESLLKTILGIAGGGK
ncbi:MAG: DUF512 domain-containing protein [Chitinophagales bacterium]